MDLVQVFKTCLMIEDGKRFKLAINYFDGNMIITIKSEDKSLNELLEDYNKLPQSECGDFQSYVNKNKSKELYYKCIENWNFEETLRELKEICESQI